MDLRDKLKSSFGRFMYGLADLIFMNLVTLLCCLPIVTIGPALCALYSITLKLVRDEVVYTFHAYFPAFKSNFRKGMILGLIAIFAAVVIFTDGVYAFSLEGTPKIVFCIVTGVVGAIWLTYMCYVFALQARFENTIKGHIKNAFLLAFSAPVHTIVLWLIFAAPVLLMLFLPEGVVVYIGSLYIMFGISLPVFCSSFILRNIFDHFNPEGKQTDDQSDSIRDDDVR